MRGHHPKSERWILVAGALVLGCPPLRAGSIPGTPPADPSGGPRAFEIHLGNDFFGRGGEFDDFRTQQLVFAAWVDPQWSFVLDHSILTFEGSGAPEGARLDQVSGSIARSLQRFQGPIVDGVHAGVGIRSSGEFAGARMQNGVHRLFGAAVTDLPYVGTERVDGTLWLRLERSRAHKDRGRWRIRHHLVGTALVTTDGQTDGSGAAYGVASRSWFHAWLGLRGDWREGYDRDIVQRETAEAESGVFGVLGLRLGPLLGETTHKLDGSNAFGRVSLVATGETAPWGEAKGLGVQTGVLLPDVQLPLQVRYETARWPGTVLLEGRYGRPQRGASPAEFVETIQIRAGFELDRSLRSPLVRGYVALGAGWRRQRLVGDFELEGERSPTVDRGVLGADLGIRVLGRGTRDGRHFGIQTGLSGTLPFSDAVVDFAGGSARLQQPELAVALGMLLQL